MLKMCTDSHTVYRHNSTEALLCSETHPLNIYDCPHSVVLYRMGTVYCCCLFISELDNNYSMLAHSKDQHCFSLALTSSH